MKTTRYFEEQILRKRPYLRREWIAATLADPLTREVQADDRIRWWRAVVDETGKTYILRVVTLEDGETVHNTFFDRNYREAE